MSSYKNKIGSVKVLTLQLFKKTKEKMKKLKNYFSLYFPCGMTKYILLLNFFGYLLDICITRNKNYLKLKFKSEFSLRMGLMPNNYISPYIHSITILCDRPPKT